MILCSALACAILTAQGGFGGVAVVGIPGTCAQDQGITAPVTPVSCLCTDTSGGLDGTCGGPQITPYAGYHTCLPTGNSGYQECKYDQTVTYYTSTPCVPTANYWGMLACYAAETAAGVGTIAACFTLGVWTGGAACYAAIVADAAAVWAACHYCAVNTCGASATGATHVPATPSSPDSNSGNCPESY